MRNRKWLGHIFLILTMISSIIYTTGYFGNFIIVVSITPIFLIICIGLFKNYNNILNINENKYEKIMCILFMLFYSIGAVVNRGFSFRELIAIFIILIGCCIYLDEEVKGNSIEYIKTLLVTYNIIASVAAVFGIICYINKYSIWTQSGSRYGYTNDFVTGDAILSIMNNPNTYGLMTVVSIVTTIILLTIYKVKSIRIILVGNIIIQLVCTILTGSRNAFLVLGVFIMSYLIFFYRNKYKKNIIIGLITLGVITSGIILLTSLKNHIPFVQKVITGGLTSGRAELWNAAIEGTKDNPFFGVGIRNGIATIGEKMGNVENQLGAHNGYLSLLLANGILVFITIISLIFIYLYKMFKNIYSYNYNNQKTKKLVFCFIISLLAANIPESLLWGDFNFVVIILWGMMILGKNIKSATN
ncbi:MAG: O-antigen ligase family protein [Clostridium sp.]